MARPLPDAATAPRTDGDLLTPGQVAVLFGVNGKTVARWAKIGRLPAAVCTAGGHRRYRWADVHELLTRVSPQPARPA
jgi:excisionase family DNA binding protein